MRAAGIILEVGESRKDSMMKAKELNVSRGRSVINNAKYNGKAWIDKDGKVAVRLGNV